MTVLQLNCLWLFEFLASARSAEGRASDAGSDRSCSRQRLMQTRVPEAAHYQQVCIEPVALLDEHVGNLVVLTACAIFYGIDAVITAVKHGIISLQRVRFRWMLTFHDEDADFSRLMQIGEDFANAPPPGDGYLPPYNGLGQPRH